MRRARLGAFLLAVLALAAAGQDKSKKAYELVYDDVQVLKQQVDDIRARLDRNAAELRALQDQVKALADLVRQTLTGQSGVQEDLRAVPAQYRDVLRRLDQLTLAIQRISADLAARPLASPPAAAAGEETAEAAAPPVTPPVETAARPQPSPPQPVPAPTMSPQEAYSVAYNDYLKGNYDLAVESFRLYRQQFPDSPLADNALYWIGECYDAQERPEDALNAFTRVLDEYPTSDKAAAAQLKKGLIYLKTGDQGQGVVNLQYVVYEHPGTREAELAREQLKSLGLTIR